MFKNIKGYEDSLISYLILLLGCMNFLGRGPIFFLIFCLYLLLQIILQYAQKPKWNNSFIPYILLVISAIVPIIIHYNIEELLKVLLLFLLPYCAYQVYFICNDKLLFISRVLLYASIGFFVNLLLQYYLNFIVLGYTDGSRYMLNYWTGLEIAVTTMGTISCVPIVYSFYLIFLQKNLCKRLLGVLMVIFSLYINIQTSTRAPLLLFIFIYFIMIYKLYKTSNIRTKISLILIMGFSILLILFVFTPNIGELAIYDRFSEEGLNSSRWNIALQFVEYMFVFPLGGNLATEKVGIMPHNIIQEFYEFYGFFFFVVLLVVLWRFIKRIYHLRKFLRIPVFFIITYISLYILLQCCIEPVISGYPQVFWFLLLIDGILLAHQNELRRTTKNIQNK